MTDPSTPTRTVGFACILLGIWVATYWWYQPAAAHRITLDQRAEAGDGLLAATPPATETFERPPLPQATVPPAAPAATTSPREVARATEDAPPLVLAPQFRSYTVQKGDQTWESIAARPEVFGDARLWEAVSRSNPWVTPDRLKPGVTVLKVPLDPGNIQGRVVASDPPAAASASPVAEASSPAAERTYTIQKNDTLWEISKRFYGRGNLWKAIAEANRHLIPNPDRPKPGVTIRIPPEP